MGKPDISVEAFRIFIKHFLEAHCQLHVTRHSWCEVLEALRIFGGKGFAELGILKLAVTSLVVESLHEWYDLVISKLNLQVPAYHFEKWVRVDCSLSHLVHYPKGIYCIKFITLSYKLLSGELDFHLNIYGLHQHLDYTEGIFWFFRFCLRLSFLLFWSCISFFRSKINSLWVSAHLFFIILQPLTFLFLIFGL